MMYKTVEWKGRTKSIIQVIEKLKSFEEELVVAATDNEGQSFRTVKLHRKGFSTAILSIASYIFNDTLTQ